MRWSTLGICSLLLSACASAAPETSIQPEAQSNDLSETPAHEVVLLTTSIPDIRQGYIDGTVGQIHYWEAGEGEPLLLIHQASGSCEEYAGLVPYMAAENRLICYDWPGHGMSDDPPRELLADDYTQTAIDVLDHLGLESSHILGNHGGALVAMNLGWKYPERVDKIVLTGTSGVRDMEAVQEFSDNLGLIEMNRIDREGVSLSDAWGRFTNYMPDSEPGEVLRAYLNNVTVRMRPYDAHYGILRFDRRPALLAIADKEILLMQAIDDPFVSDQETLLEILPKAQRFVIEDAGLFAYIENPRAHAEKITPFLNAD